MAFSRRRGRPKKTYEIGKDKGTSELQTKRMHNLTIEPLDLCFSKGLINEQQQNAGIRLRWLYTLKFGAPTISSYIPDDAGGHSCKYEDNNWMAKRQTEYNNILHLLDKAKSRQIVMDVCIFSRLPAFLYEKISIHKPHQQHYKELTLLVSSLDSIDKLLKK